MKNAYRKRTIFFSEEVIATESDQWSVVFNRRPSSSHLFRAAHSFRSTSNGSEPMVALDTKWRRGLTDVVGVVQWVVSRDSTMCWDDAKIVVAHDRERWERISEW